MWPEPQTCGLCGRVIDQSKDKYFQCIVASMQGKVCGHLDCMTKQVDRFIESHELLETCCVSTEKHRIEPIDLWFGYRSNSSEMAHDTRYERYMIKCESNRWTRYEPLRKMIQECEKFDEEDQTSMGPKEKYEKLNNLLKLLNKSEDCLTTEPELKGILMKWKAVGCMGDQLRPLERSLKMLVQHKRTTSKDYISEVWKAHIRLSNLIVE